MFIILTTSLAVANPVIQQLSKRDGAPNCYDLSTQQENLQQELKTIIQQDVKPSYVPMRAAQCLLELYPTDVETYRNWMVDSFCFLIRSWACWQS